MRKTLRIAAAGASVALVTSLSACASAPSNAAVVDGHVITQQQVKDGVQGVATAFGLEANRINNQVVVGALISGVQAEILAQRNNIQITDAQRDAVLATEQSGAALVKDPVGKQIAYDLADAQIVAQKIGEEKFMSESRAMNVTLNPLYGSWQDGQMTGQSGSLSRELNPQPTN